MAGKPRGYAFIEFESKRDMNEAWNMAEGMKIEGRRITVDVEKGRTVDDWYVYNCLQVHTTPLCHAVHKPGY